MKHSTHRGPTSGGCGDRGGAWHPAAGRLPGPGRAPVGAGSSVLTHPYYLVGRAGSWRVDA